jgi:transglutaminase-like putative cysteine protease
MRKFAHKGKEDLSIRRLVEQICAPLAQGDYAGECLALYYWVCQNIRYMRDPLEVEFVKEPERVLETRAGDCDDMATLLAAMVMACGNRCRFVLVGFQKGKGPSHVYLEVISPRGEIVVLDPVANRNTANMLKKVQVRQEYPV